MHSFNLSKCPYTFNSRQGAHVHVESSAWFIYELPGSHLLLARLSNASTAIIILLCAQPSHTLITNQSYISFQVTCWFISAVSYFKFDAVTMTRSCNSLSGTSSVHVGRRIWRDRPPCGNYVQQNVERAFKWRILVSLSGRKSMGERKKVTRLTASRATEARNDVMESHN